MSPDFLSFEGFIATRNLALAQSIGRDMGRASQCGEMVPSRAYFLVCTRPDHEDDDHGYSSYYRAQMAQKSEGVGI